MSAGPTPAVRDLLARVEHDVRVATAWAAHEPAGAELEARVRDAAAEVVGSLWRAGRLVGDVAEDACFVRCDRTTTTQVDLDAGRLVVLVGVAPLRPAEFELVGIGLWTGDAWQRGGEAFRDGVAVARRQLHAVAEGVLAGPQHARSGTIRLRAVAAGFATVADPALLVQAGTLVADDTLVPLRDATYAEVAHAVGVEWRVPDLYGDHAAVGPDDAVAVDPATAVVLGDWLHLGDEVLRAFAPGETPVLWPEHFDVAVAVDEVTYGLSPGDDWSPEPYAYAAPYDRAALPGGPDAAPFGLARRRRDLPDRASVLAFLRDARARLTRSPGRSR